MTGLGLFLGWAALSALVLSLGNWAQAHYGLTLQLQWPGEAEAWVLGLILLTGLLASLVPAWRAYRLALVDGLSPRT